MSEQDAPPRPAEAAPPASAPGAAICHRCGGGKRGPYVPCKACGFVPAGPERQVAWLFSEHHLAPDELAEAARRLQAGERPDPSRSLLERARVQMGAGPLTDDARRPLRSTQLVALGLANVLLTPFVGLAVWWGLREERPVAAAQALRSTVPVALGLAVVWGGLLARWTLYAS